MQNVRGKIEKIVKKGKEMRKLIVGALLTGLCSIAQAETIATMPNRAGGKIVLTDDACVYQGKNYNNLNRAYNYTESGYTQEACWGIEGETVVVFWLESSQKMRYPIENFTMNQNYKGGRRGKSL